MSMFGGGNTAGASDVGQTVASFPTYEGAQKSVSTLIAGEVPARDIAIVGLGLRSVERITGRLGYATAARSGAVNGLLLGLLFSAFLVLGTTTVPIQAFVGVLFVGIAIGMLLSLVTFAFVRRRRAYASVMQVLADHYEVTVAAASVHKARQVLSGTGGASTSASPAPSPATPAPQAAPERPASPADEEPPRYGERLPAPEQSPGADATPGAPEGDSGATRSR